MEKYIKNLNLNMDDVELEFYLLAIKRLIKDKYETGIKLFSI